MIDKRREDLLQRYPRYIKMEINIVQDLDTALINIKEPDIDARKKGAKRLSWNSRREPFYSIRIWFLQEENKQQIFAQIIAETDEKIKADLVKTLYFFYGRYIVDALWWKWTEDEKIVNENYRKTVLSFAHSLVDKASLEVLSGIASLLLILGDNTGWDIYVRVLTKRNNKELVNWFCSDCRQYADKTMTLKQSVQLIDILSDIIEKTKNNYVVKVANDGKAFLIQMFDCKKD